MDRFDIWVSRAMFLALFVSIVLMLVVAAHNYLACSREEMNAVRTLRATMRSLDTGPPVPASGQKRSGSNSEPADIVVGKPGGLPAGVQQQPESSTELSVQDGTMVGASANDKLIACIEDVESLLQQVNRTDTVAYLYTLFSLAYVGAGVFLLNKVRETTEGQEHLQRLLSSTVRNASLLSAELSNAYQISMSVRQAALNRRDDERLAWFAVVCPQLRESLAQLKILVHGMIGRREQLSSSLKQTFVGIANSVEDNLGELSALEAGTKLIEQMEEIRHLIEALEDSGGN